MKKTTLKVSWDNAQNLNRFCADLSISKNEKITQDVGIRYLLEFYRKNKTDPIDNNQ